MQTPTNIPTKSQTPTQTPTNNPTNIPTNQPTNTPTESPAQHCTTNIGADNWKISAKGSTIIDPTNKATSSISAVYANNVYGQFVTAFLHAKAIIY